MYEYLGYFIYYIDVAFVAVTFASTIVNTSAIVAMDNINVVSIDVATTIG
jgi:hypothetical protein